MQHTPENCRGRLLRRAWPLLLAVLVMAGWAGASSASKPDQRAPSGFVPVQGKPAGLLSADSARLTFKVFRDQDGLPQNSAQTLATDRDGRIWVGTQDGAAVYNGRVWRVVDMPSKNITNSVRIVLHASNGDLWFGCDGAVNRLRDGKWTVFTRNDGLPEGWTRSMLEVPGPAGEPEVWIGTDTGYGRFDGTAWTDVSEGTELAGTPVRCLFVDRQPDGDGSMWIGTDGKGIWSLKSPFRSAPVRDESFNAKSAYCLSRIHPAGDSSELIAGTETGIVRASSTGGWEPVAMLPGQSFSVRCLLETTTVSGGRMLWAGTYDAGLLIRERGFWTVYTAATGLPHDKIDSLLGGTNADGVSTTVWVGTDAAGIARAEMGRWRTLPGPASAPYPVVLAIKETESFLGRPEMWVGTYGSGLLRFVDGQWRTSGPLAPPKVSGAWTILESRSPEGQPELWVGTDGEGVLRYANNTWSRFDPGNGFPNSLVYCLLESRNERGERVIWAGTGGSGIVRYENGKWTPIGLADDAPSLFIQCMAETVDADGVKTLWAGTLGGGLGRFKDGRWTQFNTATGFPNESVYSLTVVQDSNQRPYVLVGTAGSGLLRFDPAIEEPEFSTVAGGTSETVLPNNVVYNPKFDRVGRMYIPTNKGITRLTPRAADAAPEWDAVTFTVDDGLPSNECNVGTTEVDASGRIWIGTVRGLAVFDPAEDVVRRTDARILLEPTTIDEREFQGFDLGGLTHDQVQITFEYSLLSTFREQDTRYRTQLAGFEDHPTAWTTDFKRQFTSLPPGDYVFRIWAKDFAAAEIGPAEVMFTVKPAPWLTWWAFALYGLAVMAIVYAGVRWRLASLNRRNQELEQKIADRTAEMATSEKRALEANRAKSVFLANMSHELRTPLNAILGFLQLLERDRDLTVKHRETLGIIARSGEHLLSLINDVLSVSKIEAGQLTLNNQVFDLRRLLQGLEEMFRVRAEQKSLSFQFEVLENVPRFVMGDEGKLRQILINLLGNAFKFTDEGGVALTVRWEDGHGVFRVRDTGQGIDPDERASLFVPFVQTRSGERAREGTGLGLAISRNFARMMGGDITVESVYGEGSTFSVDIDLPRSAQALVEPEQRKVRSVAGGQPQYKILVVDDKWENRSLLVRLLEDVNFTVREAANGRQAIEIWEDWDPDLIWMDMRMPVMDGLEATKLIRERAESQRPVIIALTASAFEQDRREILAGGCDDYVAKPFRDHEIFARMNRHLGVEYEYDVVTVESRQGDAEATRLSPGDLAALPEDVLAELRSTAEIGDIRATLDVVDRIREIDPALAVRLGAVVRAYDFETLQNLLEKIA